MYVYTYVHMYIYICVCMYIYTYCTYIYAYTYVCTYTYMCMHTHSLTPEAHARTPSSHTHRRAGSVPCCPHNHTRCSSLRPYIRPLLPAFRVRHIVYICTHVGSAARIIKLVKETHTHMHISDAHGSTHALAWNTPYTSPTTYLISRARSVRVCVQQRCHYLWPGLLLCGIMQW